MVELADELCHGIAHQARVGIQRHDILDVLRNDIGAGKECRVAVTPQQQVQLVQLATLALPAHPDVFGRIVEATTVQQVEPSLAVEIVAL